jgi:hypothetical protein
MSGVLCDATVHVVSMSRVEKLSDLTSRSLI